METPSAAQGRDDGSCEGRALRARLGLAPGDQAPAARAQAWSDLLRSLRGADKEDLQGGLAVAQRRALLVPEALRLFRPRERTVARQSRHRIARGRHGRSHFTEGWPSG